MRLTLSGALCAAISLLAPAVAQASLLSETVTAGEAQARQCTARPAPEGAAGVAQRQVRATASGLVEARLAAASGDWDLAVFDGDRLVAGAASFGAREVASGVVGKGTELLVQACRRSGDAGRADLRVDVVPVGPGTGETLSIVRVQTPGEGARMALEASGLDLTEHARRDFREVLLHDAEDLATLRTLKLDFTTEIADVVAADRRSLFGPSSRSAAGPEDAGPMPSGRTEYRRLPDFQADMKALAEANPGLVRGITMPEKSLEGRSIEGVEITEDVAADDGKPVFAMTGVHHAREWPSAEMPMEWVIDLVKDYNAGDARARKLLREIRVIMVPVINPDGYNLSREAPVDSQQPVVDPSFAYKRKNCRVTDFAIPAPGECGQQANRDLGTDPNRNYGGFWGGPGADVAADSETYRGAGPFSEPETRNVKWLLSTRQVTTFITNHTYSDLILRPPGISAEGDPPDEPVYKALGDAMAAETGYLSQKSFELYDTTGGTEDWSYYATGGLGFTFEIGKASEDNTLVGVGFHPRYPIGVTAEYFGKYPGGGGNREAYYVAALSTADRARHSVLQGEAPAGATLRLTKTFDTYTSRVLDENGNAGNRISFTDRLEDTLAVPGDGRFTWAVNPSTRPFARKQRVDSDPAATPAVTQDISSDLPTSPPTAGEDFGARLVEFDVPASAQRLIKVTLDGEDGDDYDIFLMRDGKDVASSTSADADETISFAYPTPGRYTLRIENWLATGGYQGAIELFTAQPGTERPLPFGTEAWTLTCEVGGRVAGQEQVVVDRGEVKPADPCGTAAQRAAAQAGVLGQSAGAPAAAPAPAAKPKPAARKTRASKRVRVATAMDRRRLRTVRRRGLRARFSCSKACRPSVRLAISRKHAKRLGIARSSKGSKLVTIGKRTLKGRYTGRKTFTVKLTRTARRRLARTKRVVVTASFSTTVAGKRYRRTKRLILR